MPKKCPDDKILNPDTGRCVKKDGRIGKQLLKKKQPVNDEKKEAVKQKKKSKNCFDDLSDYTRFSNKISSIKGRGASSSSTSDIYVLTLDDGREAYMKVFSTDDDVSHVNLKYEFVVYMLRIKFLSLISPNFVTPIAGKMDSDFHEIIKYLENKVKDEKTGDMLKTDDLIQRFHRNITLANVSELKKIPKRPSIGKDMFKNKYGYIVTGPSLKDMNNLVRITSLRNFIDYNRNQYELYVWEIVTQIAVSCYLMHLSELVHNDLHSGNILVYVYKNPINIQYNLGTKKNPYTIQISTPFVIKIYDFDRSNMFDTTGKYENHFTQNMISSGQDQLNIDTKDFVKALCYLPETVSFNKARLVLKDMRYFNEYDKLFDGDCFFERYGLSNQAWKNRFNIFRSIEDVLKKLSKERTTKATSFDVYDLYSDVINKDLENYEYELLKVCKDPNARFTNFLNLN